MKSISIRGGDVLLEDGLRHTDLALRDGLIEGFGSDGDITIDATGLLVLPGIVDIHGDAFERQVQPRPGVDFPIEVALAETEAQLLANGITTAFHGVTLSWEPGLRSVQSWSRWLDALDAARPTSACDMRVHLRFEAFNLPALDTAIADIQAGRVHLLAFNDHTPGIVKKLHDPAKAAKFSDRGPMSLDEFRELAHAIAARASEVPAAQLEIAAAARAAGLPMASHDDATLADRDHFRKLGAAICEFPITKEVGQNARDAGEFVVMGAPNALRGGSHLGWASAASLAEEGICNILASDYYYPAMLGAAFVLLKRGQLSLAQAWSLISANPATAAGLTDRGRIAPGLRGDVVLVDPAARAVATIAGGRLAWVSANGGQRIQ